MRGDYCAICGAFVKLEDSFRCRKCKRGFLCRKHFNEKYRMCKECAEALIRRRKGKKPEEVKELPREIEENGMEMVLVPAGEFTMGSSDEDEDAGDDEKPAHWVYLDAYYIGKYPVTNAQYRRFTEDTGHPEPESWGDDDFNSDKQPVVGVSWKDAVSFCRWMSKKTGREYRLPTEAEWEKAARGTNGRKYPWGDEAPDSTLCNFNDEIGKTTEVGSYPQGASPYGCQDMAGNVWEWCNDWYDEDYYKRSPQRNPQGPSSGGYRVLRGGSWSDSANDLRSAFRDRDDPDYRSGCGFRCAASCTTF